MNVWNTPPSSSFLNPLLPLLPKFFSCQGMGESKVDSTIFHPSDGWDHSFHFLHKNAAADRVSKSPLRKKKHKRWRETDKNVKYLKSSILYITYSHTFNFKRFVHHLLLIVRLWNWHDESIRWRPISLKYVWRNLEKKKS